VSLDRILARARASLVSGAAGDVVVLPRADGAPAVAFLVTIGRAAGELVVPLRAGRDRVGRGDEDARPFGPWPRPYAVEQYQWRIECGDGSASVADDASTSQSVLVPAAIVGSIDLARDLRALAAVPGVVELPHPSCPGPLRHVLAEGDVLRGAYAAFAFGWCRAGRRGDGAIAGAGLR
jgi:hypothetical protein